MEYSGEENERNPGRTKKETPAQQIVATAFAFASRNGGKQGKQTVPILRHSARKHCTTRGRTAESGARHALFGRKSNLHQERVAASAPQWPGLRETFR